jgi:hypothetical protein
MKRLIITEEERRNILLKHGSKSVLTEAAKDDVIAIQKSLGLTADGVAGPKTVSSILTKLGGGTPAATTQTTTVAAATTQTTTVAAATTQTTTVAASTTTPASGTTTFSAVPVAGAATLEAACGNNKTNKDFRLCKRVFKKTTK